jgi:hypothetical protein
MLGNFEECRLEAGEGATVRFVPQGPLSHRPVIVDCLNGPEGLHDIRVSNVLVGTESLYAGVGEMTADMFSPERSVLHVTAAAGQPCSIVLRKSTIKCSRCTRLKSS